MRLDVADFDAETGAVTIRAGKGRKDRIAYTSNGSLAAVQGWLAVRSTEPGPLFIPVMKGGRMVVRRLIPHAIYKMLGKRAQQAGVKAFSPHDLRLVRSIRIGRTVRQHVLADLGQAPSLDAALRQWPAEIAHLRQRGAAARSAAARLCAQMRPGWLPDGVVPRPSRRRIGCTGGWSGCATSWSTRWALH